MSEQLCSMCRTVPATFLCFCKELLVCGNCLADHLLSNPSLAHKPTPLRTPALDRFLAPSVQPHPTVEIKKAREALSEALERVVHFRNSALLDLQHLRQQWTYDIDRVIEDFVQTVSLRTQTLADTIKQRLETLEDLKSDQDVRDLTSLRLELEIRTMDIAAVLKKGVDLVVSPGSGEGLDRCLYKFFGGCDKVAVFDPHTESVELKMTVGQSFFHNSSWCLSPTNQIYITGGSLTGRSRSDCLVYHPYSNLCLEARQMQVARRSHASIYHNRHCYVFGGLVDAEKTSLCESFSGDQETWETLPQMKDRRAYLGCCELKGKIYIAGGAGNSAVEILDPDRREFERMELGQLALEDSCSMLSIDDCILLFHGNFSGQVSRWTPCTGQVSTSALSYGNSWSNSAPLLYNRTVYFLRSDNVYRLHIDTDDTVFVQRLARAAARPGALVLN